MRCDFLIVGAGFAGSVIAERIASESNFSVIVIDKRLHIGGNAFDFRDENGILIHKYGPHFFHSVSNKPVDYLSQFTEWIPYQHKTLGLVDGKLIPIPFNFNSLYEIFPFKYAKLLENKLLAKFGFGLKIPILKLQEDEDEDIKFLSDYIYKNVFLNYTQKQWGYSPNELDPSVTARIPVLLSRDNRYFQDKYQALPKDGYTPIFERMLNKKNIKLLLNTSFKDVKEEIDYSHLIYTGAIDEFFDFQFGHLPYRSLKFEFQKHNLKQFQPNSVVNYPNNNDFTRITEFKHLMLNQKQKSTTIAIEFPEKYIDGINERFYPIPQSANTEIYNQYLQFAQENVPNTIFIGRLAEYKYYNMNEVISVALMTYENKIKKLKI
jgi:UDP-galactopyranose mutase